MDCHHPQFVATATIHVTPHFTTTAPHLRQKGCQRHPTCRTEGLCEAKKVIKCLIHRRAKPSPEFLPCLDQYAAVEPENRGFIGKSPVPAEGVGIYSKVAVSSSMCHQPCIKAAVATAMSEGKQRLLVDPEERRLQQSGELQIILWQAHHIAKRQQILNLDLVFERHPVGTRHRNAGLLQRRQ